ncbi:ethanolaminephosphotransferase 1 [Westerdykella ornata]|uniref:Ethanolaminephosphotransferase 1 n=1 Tax=Westerdykella ornata TaxID=318751 RepID=A0A6A6JYB5_WESOR|nr:ethanolaminephosphotransferase 1 [Westerdykella ornata]KAF2281214.1 ethanolaminephosphotransferase 1 [Westerdykella ornata]
MPSAQTAAHECVSEEALQHLRLYKYSSVDKSFISRYVLKHYWNGFVELLPMWLAPNLVTLLGFCFILGNIIILELYVPDLVGPAPSWVYFSFAFGLWMYSTMDNVDGKQARRTGTSSPLGELFDHGIDSLNCTLASLLEVAAMGYGASKTGAFTALVPVLPMFFSTWETYHTHTLYLGYFNGPTEGLIIACLIMCASGYYGPDIWSTPLAAFAPSYEKYLDDITFRDLWVPIILVAFFVAHLPACVVNVARARRAQNLPIAPLFCEWIPIIVFVGASMAWLGSPYSFILKDNHLVLYCLVMSLVCGRMTTKIILAHLTRQPFPYWTVMLVPMVGGALLVNHPYVTLKGTTFGPVSANFELWYLRAYFVFAAVVYGRWAHLVITSICNFLGINCLTIAPKPLKKESGLRSPGLPNGVRPEKGRTD